MITLFLVCFICFSLQYFILHHHIAVILLSTIWLQLLVAFRKITVRKRKGDREQQLTHVYYFCLILFFSILLFEGTGWTSTWIPLLPLALPAYAPPAPTHNNRQGRGACAGLPSVGPTRHCRSKQKISAATRQRGWIQNTVKRMQPLQDRNMQGDSQLIAKCEAAFPPRRDIAMVTRDTEGRVTDYYHVCGQCSFLRAESVDWCSRVQWRAPVIQVTERPRLLDRLSSGVLSCSGLCQSGVCT